jgi:hypothetical protein
MQDWFNLSNENFPPVDMLNQKQIKLLVEELLKLWRAFSFDQVLPKGLPADISYKLFVDYLEKPVIWVSDGIIGIEFCDNDTANCPFPNEYCMCKDLDDDEEDKDTSENSREVNFLNWEMEVFFADKKRKFKTNKKIQKYVDQLIGDIEQKAKEGRERPSIPANIDIRGMKNNLDLIEKPFVSLVELLGIK